MAHTTVESAKLVVKLHGQNSRTIDLVRDTFTIGRNAHNDLVIDDHTVSNHHAKIIRIQSVYFVEDLKSTNGTTLNGKPIERAQLHDTDVIAIGQHRFIFQENAPAAAMVASVPSSAMEQTMAITGRSLPSSSPLTSAKVLVTAGKTDRLEYHLTKSANLIGSQEGATIQLTGWFAPKAAALITQQGGLYSIGLSQTRKKVLVNGKEIFRQQPLQDGDVIEVAGVSMTFYLLRSNK